MMNMKGAKAMMSRWLLLLLLLLLLLPVVCTGNPYGDEDEDEDEDEELLVVGDATVSDENERLESLHHAAGDAPAPPTPTPDLEDPLKGIIDAALNSPAIFPQRLKVNFGASELLCPGCNGCCDSRAPL